MTLTLKIKNMSETLNRPNVNYPHAPILLHALFSEWGGFIRTGEATEEESPLPYIYEELDWLYSREEVLTEDEYIVLRHVACAVAEEKGW